MTNKQKKDGTMTGNMADILMVSDLDEGNVDEVPRQSTRLKILYSPQDASTTQKAAKAKANLAKKKANRKIE